MNRKQSKTRQQGANGKQTNRLRIARETVKSLTKDELRDVAGGGKVAFEISNGWQEC